jgi:AraC-like DNA-binding protein
VRAAGTSDEFLRRPVGRYFGGPSFLVWCASPQLAGTCFIGRNSADDIRALVRLSDFDRAMTPPYDVIIDGRYLQSVVPDAFAIYAEYVQRRLPEYARLIRRQAIVHATGMVGAVLSGALTVMKPAHTWKTFDALDAAMSWLEPPRPSALAHELEGLIQSVIGDTPIVRAVRQQLAARCDLPMAAVAKAIGLSERSLQRGLGVARTSFRAEQQRARIAAAKALLAETDSKLEAIARTLGYRSVAHFTTLFRRSTGETPSAYRAANAR